MTRSPRTIVAVWHKHRYHSAAAERFLGCVREVLAGMRPPMLSTSLPTCASFSSSRLLLLMRGLVNESGVKPRFLSAAAPSVTREYS